MDWNEIGLWITVTIVVAGIIFVLWKYVKNNNDGR